MANNRTSANPGHIIVPDDLSRALIKLNNLLGELFLKWEPHQFQIDLISSVVVDRHRITAAETGRQVGKTEAIVVAAGLWSQMVPGSQSYYLAPMLKQARKILWDSGRIEAILPGNWIEDFKEKTSMVMFAGSSHCFLVIDGADKFDAQRGVSVRDGIVFLDECRDMRDGVWDTIKPSLGVHKCPAVFTSTPPENLHPNPSEPDDLHWFCQIVDQAQKDEDSLAIFAKTEDNPHFPKETIEQEREHYYAKDRGYVFEREFMGRRVEGKATLEWPMLLNKDEYVFAHDELMEEISRDLSKMRWYCMTDPAGASVWAWLLIGFNPYSRIIYVMDELYEKEKGQMATSLIWPKISRKMASVYNSPDSWRKYYDEAEKWFQNEIYANYRVKFNPTQKASRSKEEGFRLMSDIFLRHKVKISDKCTHTFWEFSNYEDDKSSDHEVDNFRYFLQVSGYSLPEKDAPEGEVSEAEKRFRDRIGMIQKSVDQYDWQDAILKIH